MFEYLAAIFFRRFVLDLYQTTESPRGIVRLGAVVIRKDSVVPAIAEDGTAEFSDVRGRYYPARRFQIELAKFLQLSILLFC